MNHWHILDLAPTSNVREIKRAYAKKLKLIDQEQNPQDFLELRQAFEDAQYAAELLSSEEVADESDTENFWDNATSSSSQEFHPLHIDLEEKQSDQVPEALSYNIYNDLNQRIQHDEPELEQNQHHSSPSTDQFIRYNIYETLEIPPNQEHTPASEPSTFEFDHSTNAQEDTYKQQRLLDPHGIFVSYNVYDDLDQGNHDNGSDDSSTSEQPNQDHNPSEEDVQPPEDLNQPKQKIVTLELQLDDDNHHTDESNFYPHNDPIFDNSKDEIIKQETFKIIEALQQHDFSVSLFNRFSALLSNLQDTTLETQIELKEQLKYCLAFLDIDEFEPKFAPFISLWYQYYPQEEDCLQQNYSDQRLAEYATRYLKHDQIYHALPPKLQFTFQNLCQDQNFKASDIFSLYSYLVKTLKIESPTQYLQDLAINNRDQNANFIYLKLIENNWSSIWWLVFNVIINCFIQLFFEISILSHILIFMALISWHIFIQNGITAYLVSQMNSKKIVLRLSQVWFISGLILCATPDVIPPLVHQIFTFLWITLTATVFHCAEYLFPSSLKKFLFDTRKIIADAWITSIVFGFMVLALLSAFSKSFHSEYIWLMSFALIPLGLILFNSFFYHLYTSFGYRLKLPDDAIDSFEDLKFYDRKQRITNLAVVSFKGICIFTGLYFLFDHSQSQYFFYLSIFSFLTLFITTFNTSSIQYVFKYLSYILSIIATLMSVVLPLLFAFFLYRTARSDHALRYQSE